MQNFRNKVIALAAIGILVVSGSLMNSPHAVVQGASAGPTVTIDPTQLPLPVRGSTSVSGTVAATQQGAWSVGITGLPTFRNADEPGRSPFLGTEIGGGGYCDSDICTEGEQFTGPGAHTRLVVRNIAIRMYTAPGTKPSYATLFSCPTPDTVCNSILGQPNIVLPLTLQAASVKVASGFGLYDVWVSNQNVEFFVEGGSVPEVLVISDAAHASPDVRGSVTGYTVSLP